MSGNVCVCVFVVYFTDENALECTTICMNQMACLFNPSAQQDIVGGLCCRPVRKWTPCWVLLATNFTFLGHPAGIKINILGRLHHVQSLYGFKKGGGGWGEREELEHRSEAEDLQEEKYVSGVTSNVGLSESTSCKYRTLSFPNKEGFFGRVWGRHVGLSAPNKGEGEVITFPHSWLMTDRWRQDMTWEIMIFSWNKKDFFLKYCNVLLERNKNSTKKPSKKTKVNMKMLNKKITSKSKCFFSALVMTYLLYILNK